MVCTALQAERVQTEIITEEVLWMLRKQKLLAIKKSHAQYLPKSILKSALTFVTRQLVCGVIMPPKTSTSNSSDDVTVDSKDDGEYFGVVKNRAPYWCF